MPRTEQVRLGQSKSSVRSIYDLIEFLETTTVEVRIDVEQLLIDQQQALELGKTAQAAEEQQLKSQLYVITRYIRENNEMRCKQFSILNRKKLNVQNFLMVSLSLMAVQEQVKQPR